MDDDNVDKDIDRDIDNDDDDDDDDNDLDNDDTDGHTTTSMRLWSSRALSRKKSSSHSVLCQLPSAW